MSFLRYPEQLHVQTNGNALIVIPPQSYWPSAWAGGDPKTAPRVALLVLANRQPGDLHGTFRWSGHHSSGATRPASPRIQSSVRCTLQVHSKPTLPSASMPMRVVNPAQLPSAPFPRAGPNLFSHRNTIPGSLGGQTVNTIGRTPWIRSDHGGARNKPTLATRGDERAQSSVRSKWAVWGQWSNGVAGLRHPVQSRGPGQHAKRPLDWVEEGPLHPCLVTDAGVCTLCPDPGEVTAPA